MSERIAGSVVWKLKADAEGIRAGLEQANKAFAHFEHSAIASLRAITGMQLYQGAKEGFHLIAEAIREVEEAARIEARLDKVVENTGHAAGMTSEQMHEMAVEMEYTTNFSRHAVAQAEALLATFTNIRGVQFTDTLKAAADLASLHGTDITAEIMALGKALEDPENGFKALKSAGIVFTEEMKGKIKELQTAGNIEGAQAKMLEHIKGRMAGMAEAIASPLQQAGNHIKAAWEAVLSVVHLAAQPLLHAFNGLAFITGAARDLAASTLTSLVPTSHQEEYHQTQEDLRRVREEADAAAAAFKRMEDAHRRALAKIDTDRTAAKKERDSAVDKTDTLTKVQQDRITNTLGGNAEIDDLLKIAQKQIDEAATPRELARAEEYKRAMEVWATSYRKIVAEADSIGEAKRLELELERQIYGANEARLRQLEREGASQSDLLKIRELQLEIDARKPLSSVRIEHDPTEENARKQLEADAKRISESVKTPEQRLRAELKRIGEAVSAGLLEPHEQAHAEADVLKRLRDLDRVPERQYTTGSFSPYASTMMGASIQQQIADNTAGTKKNTEEIKNKIKPAEQPAFAT